MILDLVRLKQDNLYLEGEYTEDIFELEANDFIRSAGKVCYQLEASLQEESLLLSGSVSSSFQAQCTGCLLNFSLPVHLENYYLLHEFEGGKKEATIDLTDRIREDILLALPGYPRCDKHGVDGEQTNPCSVKTHLQQLGSDREDSQDQSNNTENGNNTGNSGKWDALDALN